MRNSVSTPVETTPIESIRSGLLGNSSGLRHAFLRWLSGYYLEHVKVIACNQKLDQIKRKLVRDGLERPLEADLKMWRLRNIFINVLLFVLILVEMELIVLFVEWRRQKHKELFNDIEGDDI